MGLRQAGRSDAVQLPRTDVGQPSEFWDEWDDLLELLAEDTAEQWNSV
jgi:hypothetical protein